MRFDEKSNIPAIVFGLAIAAFAAFQQFKLPVVLPILLEEYRYERTLAGAFMSIYALVGLIFSISLGRVISKLGAFAPLLAGLLLFSSGSFLTLALPEQGLLVLLGRGLEGLGFAVAAIVGPVIANAAATARLLPIVAGFVAAWIPVGQLAASFLAPLFLALSDWRGLWWFAIVSSLAFIAWTWTVHRRSPEILAPAQKGEENGRSSVALSSKRKLAFVATGAIYMFWSAQYFAYMTWLPQYLVERHSLGLDEAMLGYLIPVALVMVSCIAGGGLLRLGASLPWLLIAALALQSLVWWSLSLVEDVMTGIISLCVFGASAGLVPACLLALPSLIMGSGRGTGVAFGFVMTGRNMGVFAGPLLLASVFSVMGSWDLASPLFGAVTTACLPFAIGLIFLLTERKALAN